MSIFQTLRRHINSIDANPALDADARALRMNRLMVGIAALDMDHLGWIAAREFAQVCEQLAGWFENHGFYRNAEIATVTAHTLENPRAYRNPSFRDYHY